MWQNLAMGGRGTKGWRIGEWTEREGEGGGWMSGRMEWRLSG